MSLDANLATTTKYVTAARVAFARQLVRISKLESAGRSTCDAQQDLQVFRSTLTMLEAHERRLRQLKGRIASA